MSTERKEKVKKIFSRIYVVVTTVLSFAFILCLVVACSQGNKKQNNNIQVACAESEVIVFKQDNKKLVSYNDEEYTITLSADELNNYTWSYLGGLFNNNYVTTDFNGTYITSVTYAYIGDSWVLDSSNDYAFNDYAVNESLFYSYTDDSNIYNYIGFYLDDFKFYLNLYQESPEVDTYSNFSSNIVWQLTEDNYFEIKPAIELDIQANSQDINNGIFDTLTESTVDFIGVIGSGIVGMTAVFYDFANSQLTTIGLLSVIVVAISLTYFLFRLIIGLIRMRG